MKTQLLALASTLAISLTLSADPLPGAIDADSLGQITTSDWVSGTGKDIVSHNATGAEVPYRVIWSKKAMVDGHPLVYGDSKTPGVRHLRISYDNPVTIGSILASGGGSVSVLKPGATAPGDIADDSQWIPAQRLKDGAETTVEAAPDDLVVWTLPTPIATTAIRFTHTAQASDLNFGGALGGIALYPDRLTNVAPQALVAASASENWAYLLNNGKNGRLAWANISMRDGERPKTIAESPEWALLVWSRPVTLQGVAFLGNEWSDAEIQAYTGPANRHPREAEESDWQTIRTVSGVAPQYPSQLDLVPVAFDALVTTRALRVRFVKTADDVHVHPHLVGFSKGGKRVALTQLIALEPIGTAALATAVIPGTPTEAHAPIPIRFTLPEAGEVTLVIDDASGKRVRNLVSQTPFPKGDNVVWWDGSDDLKRDLDMTNHGIYSIPPEFVAPGSYTVHGLWHKPLDLRYQMVVDAPGNPPWPSADGAGGWLTTHTPASCTLFVPASKAPGGEPLVYLGDPIAEGGSALAWLDLAGNKVGGRGWIGGSWTGAQFLASDSGANAEPGVYAYAGSTFVGNKKYGINGKVEIRLTKLTTNAAGGDKPVLTPTYVCTPLPAHNELLLGGLAVHNGLLVFSQPAMNQLVFVNAKEGKVLFTAPLPSPRGLAFDSDGRLLALSGKSLLRYALSDMPTQLPSPETLVSNLEDPQGITVDSSDKIYVSDQGNSHQVKVFSTSGSPVATIGHPGVPKAGIYDPLHMNNPAGLTVDSNGRLWVAEISFEPKRVSVWNADGTLWKAYYGGPRYGGGGTIDPKDPTRFMYDGMEFHLDWDKATSSLSRVYYLPGPDTLKLAFRDAPPETPVYANGQRYLTDAFNSGATNGHDTAVLFIDDGTVAKPVALAGNAFRWDTLKEDAFQSRWPQGIDPKGDGYKTPAFFIWSDLNGDGKVDPDEVTIIPGTSGGITVGDDGSFLASRVGDPKGTPQATRFKPVKFTDRGVPVYDANAGDALAPAQGPGSDGGDQVLTGTGGWVVMTTPPPPFSKLGVGGAKDGAPAWGYPSLWPGLHASHSSPAPDHPGELVGTTRLLGPLVTPNSPDAGPLFFINSNQGDIYSFTQDGLFVAQLFQDIRQGQPWEMPVAQRDMLLNDQSLHDENFFPAVAQSPDGKIYILSGAMMAIVRVDNLDTIHRIAPMTLQVSADDLKLAQNYVVAQEASRLAAQGSSVLTVALKNTPPTLAGNLSDWNDAQFAPIDHRGVAAYFDAHTKPYDVSGAVTIAGGRLIAAWKTGDPKLLVNAGDAPNALFKTGGALDLMIGANPNAKPNRPAAVPGDQRLLVTQVGGKTKALLYRAVVPGTADKDKIPFNAPWHGITMDRVDDVSAQVQLVADGTGNYLVSVPLSVLGLNPSQGLRIKGDIGILRGDGKQTTQRVYWTNKATAIVSDVPSEAELTPSLWGIWEFQQK